MLFNIIRCFFSTPLSPPLFEEGGLTPVSKPYAPTIGARGVTAPARRSQPLRSKVRGASKPSPDFLRNRIAIFMRCYTALMRACSFTSL